MVSITLPTPGDPATTGNWGTTLNTAINAILAGVNNSIQLQANDKLVSNYGAKGDGKWLSDAAMTSGSAILTSATAGFVAGDVGKRVLVSGAGASGDSLSTTIATFTDSTHVVLSASASTTVSATSCVFGTDDTAAIQNASDAAAAGNGTLYFDSKTYIVGGALVQGGSRKTNSQITLPSTTEGTSPYRGRIVWQGVRDARGHLEGTYMPSDGTIIVSTLVGATYSGTYGVPSVVGGATWEQGWVSGNPNASYSKHSIQMEDLIIRTPRGPSLSAINCELMGGLTIRRSQIDTLEWYYDITGYTAVKPKPQSSGVIFPGQQNPGYNRCESIFVSGYYCAISVGEHMDIDDIYISMCIIAYGIRRAFQHIARVGYTSVQQTAVWVSGYDPTGASVEVASFGGVCSVVAPPGANTSQQYPNPLFIETLDSEIQSTTALGATWTKYLTAVLDANNYLGGRLGYMVLDDNSGFNSVAAGVSGALGMKLKNVAGRNGDELLARSIYQDTGNNNAASVANTNVWTAIKTGFQVQFVAPNPGWVQIDIDLPIYTGGANAGSLNLYFGMMDHGTGLYVPGSGAIAAYMTPVTVDIRRYRVRTYVYSLTPRTVVTWDVAWLAFTGSVLTATLYEGGTTLSGTTAAPYGPAIAEVRALSDINTTLN